VRLVGPAGEQIGIVSVTDALRLAQEADLDLVEVAPMARPPVCKLMDYGKFKYESALKARESRKNQAQTVIKEIKLRPKIDPHDYGTKKGHVERFLKQGDKVKVTIMFRGREQSRPELGFKLLQRLAGDISELGFVESSPKQDGRNMIMVIGPHKRKTEAMAAARAERASRSASRATAHSGGPSDAGDTASAEIGDTAPADIGDTAPADIGNTVPADAGEPTLRGGAAPAGDTAPAGDAARTGDTASAGDTAAARDTAPAGDTAAAGDTGPAGDTARSGRRAPAGDTAGSAGPATPEAAQPDAPQPPPARPAAPRPSAPRGTPAPRPAAPRGSTAAARPGTAAKPGPPRRSTDAPVPVAADAAGPASANPPREADP
jgi:translation initiation factor IF-3